MAATPDEIVGLDYDDDHVLRAPTLRFSVTPNPSGSGTGIKDTEDSRRLIAAVDAALARRADDVEDLEINFIYNSPWNFYIDLSERGFYLFTQGHAGDITPEHVAAWLRFAESRVTGRFTLAVPSPPPRQFGKVAAAAAEAADRAEMKLPAELLASARAQTMSLTMGNFAIAVPVAGAGAFHALSDLLLKHARVEPGGADERNLGHMLSAACCPQLRRLRMEQVELAALRLRAAATLEEIRLENVRGLTALELDAPGLRALHITGCYRLMERGSTARISAPVLETMACADACIPHGLQFDAPASLRRVEMVSLLAHAPDEEWNAGAICLLQHCTAVDSLAVEIASFQIACFVKACQGIQYTDLKEMMSCVPLLHNITNLTIKLSSIRWHELKATIARLVAKFSRVQFLSIDIKFANDSCFRSGCLCNQEDDPTISLEYLREAKITGFGSTSYHRSLVQLVITGAPALEKMTVELIKAPLSERQDDNNAELGFNMPCKGQWFLRHGDVTIYEWTADSKREEDRVDLDGPTLSRL